MFPKPVPLGTHAGQDVHDPQSLAHTAEEMQPCRVLTARQIAEDSESPGVENTPKDDVRRLEDREGILRAAPLAETISSTGLDITVISESHQMDRHRQILAELNEGFDNAPSAPATNARPLSKLGFPSPLSGIADGEALVPIGVRQPLRLSNIDKPLFGEGGAYTHSQKRPSTSGLQRA